MSTIKLFWLFILFVCLIQLPLLSNPVSPIAEADSVKSSDSCKHSCAESYKYLSLTFSKHSPPNLSINKPPYFYDGNNFYGFERGAFYKIAKYLNLGYIYCLEAGNINGETAIYISGIPGFELDRDWVKIAIGAGPSILSVGNNFYAGGIGLSSYVGIKFDIYKNFGLQFKTGLDVYSSKTYYYFGIGVVYYF
jgi:hypothetical protein